ncbi:hypothetical protein NC99_26280 [Sunxiuqinia dokdonensis]|uniref:Uncharacterized protein n=1 Tax=Sunxiuqinia dokdonensis TaxID=1409788 RepID=A0A0L8V7Y1_9BACT|nr:hypothetical protein NC99_26280 [Sunxiuqinia dokdonensis]
MRNNTVPDNNEHRHPHKKSSDMFADISHFICAALQKYIFYRKLEVLT